MQQRLHFIDSHTGGEPTRLILSGGPDLGGGTVAEQLERLRAQDWLRRSAMTEPRGHDVLVGAVLTPTTHPDCDFGLLFFNNVGYLGMCGHGTIGVVATLAYAGKISAGSGTVTFETPVGVVTAVLQENGDVSLTNVVSFRTQENLTLDVPGVGTVTGDIAWGGNWFFLVKSPQYALDLAQVEKLTETAWNIRQAVNAQGYPEVDHVELFGPPQSGGHSRNFVLCPGKAYDRSPCGTGTSAKLACLAADGKLAPGEIWVQESIVGSSFQASFQWVENASNAASISPSITGRAYVTAEGHLILDEADPFKLGLGLSV